ncbi:MAG: PQQ-binding-like beta-propeller repeat protein [Armatimonadetes bacterium]|nr:PQQ-binding-like beta-propeller repeat protein [Armatimonadota bacterium]
MKKLTLISISAVAITGMSVAAMRFLPGNVTPWRAFHAFAERNGIGANTLASYNTSSIGSIGTTYGSPVLTSGPSANFSYGYRGALVVCNTSGDVCCLPISGGGTQSWTYTTGGAIYGTPWIGNLLDLDDVFVGSDDNYFYRISNDPNSTNQGSVKAAYQTGGAIRSSPCGDESPASAPGGANDGYIYFGCDDYKIYSLRAQTPTNGDGLSFEWSYTTGGVVESSPTFDSVNVYVGSDDGYMYAIRRKDNGSLWSKGDLCFRYQTGDAIRSTPCIYGGKIFFGSRDDYIYAIDVTTQSLSWSYQTGGNVDSSPAVSKSGSNIYVGSDDGYLYCISTGGTYQWSLNLGSPIKSSPAVANDGTIFVGTDSDGVYHVSTSGSVLHHFSSGVNVYPSVAIGKTDATSGATGRAFYVTTAGNIYDIK